jgi:hypothetical protein
MVPSRALTRASCTIDVVSSSSIACEFNALPEFHALAVARSSLSFHYCFPRGSAAGSIPRNGEDATGKCRRRHAWRHNMLENGLASNSHSFGIFLFADRLAHRQSQVQLLPKHASAAVALNSVAGSKAYRKDAVALPSAPLTCQATDPHRGS